MTKNIEINDRVMTYNAVEAVINFMCIDSGPVFFFFLDFDTDLTIPAVYPIGYSTIYSCVRGHSSPSVFPGSVT